MKIINFGSLNIDHVYQVPHFVIPGETVASLRYQRFAGGKGCNQSIAMAKAGVLVTHAGKVGCDGVWLRDLLHDHHIDTNYIDVIDGASGHAVIQVDPAGENSILLYGGANKAIDHKLIERVFDSTSPGDLLILQNEINAMPDILRLSAEKELTVFFNPAPMSKAVLSYPLDHVDHLIINRVEGEQLTGHVQADAILDVTREHFPSTTIILTQGAQGVVVDVPGQSRIQWPVQPVSCVDATAAGDTFIGYYVAAFAQGAAMLDRLALATKAAALCVGKSGAACSIPSIKEVK